MTLDAPIQLARRSWPVVLSPRRMRAVPRSEYERVRVKWFSLYYPDFGTKPAAKRRFRDLRPLPVTAILGDLVCRWTQFK